QAVAGTVYLRGRLPGHTRAVPLPRRHLSGRRVPRLEPDVAAGSAGAAGAVDVASTAVAVYLRPHSCHLPGAWHLGGAAGPDPGAFLLCAGAAPLAARA